MKLGLTAAGMGRSVRIDIKLIQEAERLGYDSVWTAEAWGADAITPLAWIAAQTSKIHLGTGIMQMPARTPAMCAMQAMTVDQLSGGRLILGLGPSGPQVVEGWHGVAYGKPLARTREYIEILRRIFRREAPLEFSGSEYQIPFRGEGASGLGKSLKSILHGRADIPIWTATISPKGIRTAAEVADGFMPIWTGPGGLDTFADDVQAGFAAAGGGKSYETFSVAPLVACVIGEDLQRCRDAVRPQIALYVGGMGARGKNFYNSHVARQGWPDAAREIQDLYLEGRQREATSKVPDDLVDAITLVGPVERIRERIAEWKQTKIDTLVLSAPSLANVRTMAEICL